MYYLDKEFIESHTAEDILAITGMTRTTLTRYCKRYKTKCLKKSEVLLKDLAGTMSDVDVAKKLNISNTTVANFRRKHNIPRYAGYRGKYSKEYLIQLHNQYGSWEKAGKSIGVSKQMLSDVAHKQGLSFSRDIEYSKEEIESIHEKYGTWRNASEALGVSAQNLSDWYKIYHKDKPRPISSKYHTSHKPKRTLEELIELHNKYGSWKKAGESVGVTASTLWLCYTRLLKRGINERCDNMCSDNGTDVLLGNND